MDYGYWAMVALTVIVVGGAFVAVLMQPRAQGWRRDDVPHWAGYDRGSGQGGSAADAPCHHGHHHGHGDGSAGDSGGGGDGGGGGGGGGGH